MIRILRESIEDLINEHEIKKPKDIHKTTIGFSEKENGMDGLIERFMDLKLEISVKKVNVVLVMDILLKMEMFLKH